MKLLYLALLLLCVSCGGAGVDGPQEQKDPLEAVDDAYVEPSYDGMFNRVNWETQLVAFHSPSLDVTTESNPRKAGANTTRRCGKVVSKGVAYEFIYSDPFPKTFDFTKNPPVFTMKVLAPRAGAKVYFKLEPFHEGVVFPVTMEIQDVTTKYAGVWEDLVFDFSDMKPESNVYNKIVICFDAGEESSGEDWYFDEIRIPDDDISSICLMQRVPGNPVLRPDKSHKWMNTHIANAAIISPENSTDGNWWMYPRGGNDVNGSQEQIGVFTQKASEFNPLGPWEYYEGNPIIPVGEPGSFDEWRVLDGAPVVGPDGTTYIYYKGREFTGSNHLCVAYSSDGYHFTKLDEPWERNSGPCDAVYHDGKFYIFKGEVVDVVSDPLSRSGVQTYTTIRHGNGPSNFDNYIIWGTMVFRLKDVDKWFMAYQGSSDHGDFPDRFHVAVSNDLVHWAKVENDQPFFARGSRGQWDQCGIWYPEVIEYKDNLYMYYEGWGREGYVENRDAGYSAGQNSCTGVATCSKADFLEWAGIIK